MIVFTLSIGLALATPILLAAMGELVGQRSGVLNLGIEGIMLMGAFTSYLAVIRLGNLWLGIPFGILTGILMGLFIALFTVRLGYSQIVTGIGINILGIGLSSFLFVKLVTDVYGKVPLVGTIPPILFSQSPLTYLAIILVPLIWVLLFKTSFGLKIRAVGENPEAADASGINVYKIRFLCVLLAAALAGLAGGTLSIGTTGSFTHGMTAARGFVAISVVILSNWSPIKVLFGALLFGIVYSLQSLFQALGVPIPWQLMLTLPYITCIIALVVASRRAKAPSALLIPFIKKR